MDLVHLGRRGDVLGRVDGVGLQHGREDGVGVHVVDGAGHPLQGDHALLHHDVDGLEGTDDFLQGSRLNSQVGHISYRTRVGGKLRR